MNGTDLTPIDSAIASIEQTMRSDMAAYERDGGMQARYRGLLEAKETGALPPSPPSPIVVERREIEKLMGDPTSEYWKGPNAEQLQARYRAISHETLFDDEDERYEPPLLRLPRGADLVVARKAADILGNLPGDMRKGFKRSFDALPTAVHAASAAELAAPVSWGGSPVEPNDLARFATTPEGADLVREWRHDAPRKLARLRGRLERWLGRMPLAGQDAALAWLDSLESDEAKALYRVVTQ